jgi:hypothetical protein
MPIIHITPDTFVAPESSYRTRPGATTFEGLIMPRTARALLALAEGITVTALYHPNSMTWAFRYAGQSWRATAPIVIGGLSDRDAQHFRDCKLCRDGVWCAAGQKIINTVLGVEA